MYSYLFRTQSAGAVEYTDCISAERYNSPNGFLGYDIIPSWLDSRNTGSFGDTEDPLIGIAPKFTLIY